MLAEAMPAGDAEEAQALKEAIVASLREHKGVSMDEKMHDDQDDDYDNEDESAFEPSQGAASVRPDCGAGGGSASKVQYTQQVQQQVQYTDAAANQHARPAQQSLHPSGASTVQAPGHCTLERAQPRMGDDFECRCTYAGCQNPGVSSNFYLIRKETDAGGQDWKPLVDMVLCQSCYDHFRRHGTLERAPPRMGDDFERQCTYPGCQNQGVSSNFHLIRTDTDAGGQDWSPVVGMVLCHACYDHFRDHCTPERPLPRRENERKRIADLAKMLHHEPHQAGDILAELLGQLMATHAYHDERFPQPKQYVHRQGGHHIWNS